MKKHVILAVLFVMSFALGWTYNADAFDILPYMALQSGKWAIWQEVGKQSREGYIVEKGENGQIVRKWYDNDGNGWVFGSSEIYQVTSTSLSLIGMHDGTDMWVAEPTQTIKRSIKLNEPVFYSGVLKNQRTQATEPITRVLMITKSGIKVDTQAGVFYNCIKIKTYEHFAGTSRVSTSLLASGREGVKGWVSKIKDTTNPRKETQNSFKTEIIQFGDSNPPLP